MSIRKTTFLADQKVHKIIFNGNIGNNFKIAASFRVTRTFNDFNPFRHFTLNRLFKTIPANMKEPIGKDPTRFSITGIRFLEEL